MQQQVQVHLPPHRLRCCSVLLTWSLVRGLSALVASDAVLGRELGAPTEWAWWPPPGPGPPLSSGELWEAAACATRCPALLLLGRRWVGEEEPGPGLPPASRCACCAGWPTGESGMAGCGESEAPPAPAAAPRLAKLLLREEARESLPAVLGRWRCPAEPPPMRGGEDWRCRRANMSAALCMKPAGLQQGGSQEAVVGLWLGE